MMLWRPLRNTVDERKSTAKDTDSTATARLHPTLSTTEEGKRGHSAFSKKQNVPFFRPAEASLEVNAYFT
jgi:hypothetical protein